jgi:hypothetical protein
MVTGDHESKSDSAGDPAQGRQRRHAFEAVARALAVHGLEVVKAPDAIEAELLGELGARDDLRPLQPLLSEVETEAHRQIVHGSHVFAGRRNLCRCNRRRRAAGASPR